MGLLYNAYAHLDAMRDQPVSAQAMAIKAEAIRHINAKLADPLKAASGETIAAIACVASGSNVGSDSPSKHNVTLNKMMEGTLKRGHIL